MHLFSPSRSASLTPYSPSNHLLSSVARACAHLCVRCAWCLSLDGLWQSRFVFPATIKDKSAGASKFVVLQVSRAAWEFETPVLRNNTRFLARKSPQCPCRIARMALCPQCPSPLATLKSRNPQCYVPRLRRWVEPPGRRLPACSVVLLPGLDRRECRHLACCHQDSQECRHLACCHQELPWAPRSAWAPHQGSWGLR